MKILVSGGAGYIGSHIIKLLAQEKYQIVTIDNLTSGYKEAVLAGDFIEGDIGDKNLISKIIKEHQPDAVIHLAASIKVEESLENPIKYYQNNTLKTLNFIEVLSKNNIGNFIFSSTAAVYGKPAIVPVTENAPLLPINPYGNSKKFAEQIIKDIFEASGLKYTILRYFNVAGADPDGDLGQRFKATTNLIDKALKTARGELEKLQIYGNNFKTEDGTCVRDYIHVTDLAHAHVAALKYLLKGGEQNIFNLGYGVGFSVK